MPVLRSETAFDTSSTSTIDQKPVRARAASEASNGSSDVVSYEETAEDEDQSGEVPAKKTTRQKKDYRPKSTFWKKSFWDMTFGEKLCHIATCPEEMHELKDESLNRGPVPTQSIARENLFIVTRGMVPILIQGLAMVAFNMKTFPAAAAYPIYFLSFTAFAIAVLRRLDRFCIQYGTFDEKNIGRDRTPDKSINGLAKGILLYMLLRTGGAFYLHYNKATNPLFDFHWSYPLRLAMWQVVLDYFFYVYHRTTHEVDFLWGIHQHHHTTKHPTAILSILAEDRQEMLEIVLVPLAATLLVPMSFAELYLSLCYLIYVEMLGHSGVRAHWSHPIMFWTARWGMDLAVEDHELHHRFGKSGRNYGKQTRIYDQIFGTVTERIETYGM